MRRAIPSISAIIPTKDRPADLIATIKSLLQQTVLPQQLIIVDQSLRDVSQRQVETQFQRARREIRDSIELCYVRDASLSGLTSARNRSLALARSDVALFLDDDVSLESRFIEEIIRAYMRYPNAAGVGGIVTNYAPPPRLFWWWELVFVRGPFRDDRQPIYRRAASLRGSDPLPVTRLGGGLMSFRADAICGRRFDDHLPGVGDGEDVDFCMRLEPGAVLMIAPRARLTHQQSPGGRSRDHHLRRDAQAAHYLYWRNWNRGVKNRVCFWWLNLGYALMAVLGSLRRVSPEPWRALLSGAREGKRLARRKTR